jgi:RNA polymerase subunit RPABC4/transcription elongation factor Spt4
MERKVSDIEDEANTCPECDRELEQDSRKCPDCTAADYQD